MKNLEWCAYTYRHRKAFRHCVEKLIEEPVLRKELPRRAEVHDMDKMVMYLLTDQQTAQKLHIASQPHHLENNLPRTYEDFVEAIIDYECAPYTKPDKPLNAYDMTNLLLEWKVLDRDTGNKMLRVMEELGIARSGTVSEDHTGLDYIAGIGEVTEEQIYEEVLRYVNSIPETELKSLFDRCRLMDNGQGIAESSRIVL